LSCPVDSFFKSLLIIDFLVLCALKMDVFIGVPPGGRGRKADASGMLGGWLARHSLSQILNGDKYGYQTAT
jgi:hypothetical protein